MRRKRGDPRSEARVISKSDKTKNTCYAYFKVKKSKSFVPKLEQAEDVDKSSSSITKETVLKSKSDEFILERPRRVRHNSLKQIDMRNQGSSVLCIEDVQTIVAAQESYDGGVNCHVCGKLYKSRVCFIKHMWEHTVYWNIFEGAKNHERVLSIQAAIILYCGMESQTQKTASSDLCNLLVTSPHSSEIKNERDSLVPQCSMLSYLLCSSSQEVGRRPVNVDANNRKQEADEGVLRDTLSDDSIKRYKESEISNMFQAPSCSAETHFKESVISDRLFHVPSSSIECKYQCSDLPFLSPPLTLQTDPASSSKRMPTFVTSLPLQQLSPSVYDNRHTSADSYGTLESNEGVGFVSPLKRKRED